MATNELVDELVAMLDSPHEARWIVDEAKLSGAGAAPQVARAMAERRQRGEPLQYVLGHWPFRTLDLVVDPRALVPRPETEQLVGVALELVASGTRRDKTTACDLGTGSGAIALSLATEGGIQRVHATDVDASALGLAELNAVRTGARGITFHVGSWYEALVVTLRGHMDLVCANPPYVSTAERTTLDAELDFEPELALVGHDGSDGTPGFGCVEAVISGAVEWLAPGGWLVVEHGDAHRDAAVRCARDAGLCDVDARDDLAGKPRFLVARRRG